jgi:hypothetical protein
MVVKETGFRGINEMPLAAPIILPTYVVFFGENHWVLVINVRLRNVSHYQEEN